MKSVHSALIVGTCVAATALGGSYLLFRHSGAAATKALSEVRLSGDGGSKPSGRPPGGAADSGEIPTTSAGSMATGGTQNSPVPPRYDLLERSTNYDQVAHSLLGPAKQGDRDAQYYLSDVLAYCDDGYRAYFERDGKTRTLDEALLWASTRTGGVPLDNVRRVYDRCHLLKEERSEEVGSAAAWLAKATEAGQPAAQAMTAMKLLVAELMRAGTAPGSVINPTDVESTERDPRALLRSAAATSDPAALWRIGEAQGLLSSNPQSPQEITRDEFAWYLLACEKGYDCSEQAPWRQFICRYDTTCLSGETGVDYIKRSAQAMNIYDVDERAREIAEKLNSHAWDDIGLGP
jgi:hypothetical protein